MNPQNELHSVSKPHPLKNLLMGWLIILVSYILIRVNFLLFGLHSAVMLGCCLAAIPYLLGGCYLAKSAPYHTTPYYTLGLLLPAIIEKVVLYLLGAAFYGISVLKISSVLEAVSSFKPYTHGFTHPMARYIFNISILNWWYVLISIAVSLLLSIFLSQRYRQQS